MKTHKKVHPRKRTPAFKAGESSEVIEAPHSFVIHRGLSCPYVSDLTLDFRRIMEPFTATNLREKKINRIKDFVSMSSFFHVSHMVIFNKASTQLSFKIVRFPRGPSLTFKVHQFTLSKDVLSNTKHQFIDGSLFTRAPLVIMNNFSGEDKHLKLMSYTFQNMFPSINLANVDIGTIRRCVVFSYSSETKLVDVRHYSLQVMPVGLRCPVRKIVKGKLPNLRKCDEILEYLTGYISESDAEEDCESQVFISDSSATKGNIQNGKCSIKLHEIGPRLSVELMKIEEGLLTGEVLYNSHVVKTELEKDILRKEVEKKRKLKEERKKQQSDNRSRNINLKNLKRDKTAIESESEDDARYFREEVGEDPDEELFKNDRKSSRKRTKY